MQIAYSVIIPNYNHAAYLKKRIDSILLQSVPPDEIIILDDASTDNSLEIIQSYKDQRIRVYTNKHNSGSTFLQWNKGIALARNEIIWIAESDDYCKHEMAENILPLFSNKNISFVFTDSTIVDGNDSVITPSFAKRETLFTEDLHSPLVWEGLAFVRAYMISKNSVPNASSVLFRKSKVAAIGDEWLKYKVVGDWLFWMETAQQGTVVFIPESFNYFRKHAQTVRQSRLRVFNKEKVLLYLYLSKKVEFQPQRSFLNARIFNYWWVFLHPKHGWSFNKEILGLTPEIFKNDRQLALKILNRIFEYLTLSRKRKHA